jgi:AcrR family transcriptional regulator
MPPKAKGPRKPAGGGRGKSSGTRAREREQARIAQRIALALAMIEAIAAHGYQATRVADVVSRAGFSRKTFYEHFANKQECLLVTFDLVSGEGMRRVEHAYREADGWPERVEAAVRALFESVIENPGALRLSLIEISSAGPAGVERRERSLVGYEHFIRKALELAPGEGTVSDMTLKAVVGGLNRVLYRRVARGEADDLLALVPALVAWATSYYPSPPEILGEPPDSVAAPPALEGGRAPGTLAPHAPLSDRRGLPRGDQNISRSFVVHSQRERILDAVANLTAAEGYAKLKVEGIAKRAAVSLKAFYEHFDDKEDAFLVAYEVGHGKALACAERAYASESDWRFAVRAGLAALFNFLASEPSFAHIALIDALTATGDTAKRSTAGVNAFAKMLVPGLEEAPGQGPLPPVLVEAIAGGVFELCLHYALQERVAELPELTPSATYIALAPFVGGEQAAQIALGASSESLKPTVRRGAGRGRRPRRRS